MDTLKSLDNPPLSSEKNTSIRVINCGYSGTGTIALSLALKKLLNGPVCHSSSACILRDSTYSQTWKSLLSPNTPPRKIPALLQDALSGYVAVTDSPANLFLAELAELYPSAIFICTTTSSPPRWWDTYRTIPETSSSLLAQIAGSGPGISKEWREEIEGREKRVKTDQARNQSFRPATSGPTMLEQWESYIHSISEAPISSATSPETGNKFPKIHFVDVEQGWAPLCELLGVQVPEEKFPEVDDVAVMKSLIGEVVSRGMRGWVKVVSAVVLGAGILIPVVMRLRG